jgi:hypothetical protein
MPLNKTPVYRNLGTRVTFLYLEYEDLIAVLLIAPVAFFVGSLFDRELFGIPMKLVFQWGIPTTTVVLLLTFKYGKPRGYLADWWNARRSRTSIADLSGTPAERAYIAEGD